MMLDPLMTEEQASRSKKKVGRLLSNLDFHQIWEAAICKEPSKSFNKDSILASKWWQGIEERQQQGVQQQSLIIGQQQSIQKQQRSIGLQGR
jgi:hypothetical protein